MAIFSSHQIAFHIQIQISFIEASRISFRHFSIDDIAFISATLQYGGVIDV